MSSEPLNREQVLDELDFLATVEHALVVEYLSVACALGHDLNAEEGGATTTQERDAAGAASSLALGQMYRLTGINRGLVAAGQSAQLGRASTISSESVADIPLDPPSHAQLERVLEREEAIATAVDVRYTRLRPAVTSDPVFEGDLLEELRFIIVEDGPTHRTAVTTLRDSLGELAPTEFLRATRREPTDTLEGRLLDVSDRSYRLIQAALQEHFALQGSFRDLAVAAMEGLDQINRALVQRGLLPPFTHP